MQFVMFSKMFQSLDIVNTGEVIRDMGFDGVDLTVRPSGHVLPENAEVELPQAVKTLKDIGLSVPMITTGITSDGDEYARAVLEAAADNGIRLLKTGYWNYGGFGRLREQMDAAQKDLDGLEKLAGDYDVTLCLHMHSGNYLTAMPGLLYELIRDRDPEKIGAYIDLGHMTIEGGLKGWLLGLDLLADRIRIVAAKGAGWQYEPGYAGERPKWQSKMWPVRESAVRWEEAFACLKEIGFTGPVTVHSEYESTHSWRVLSVDEIIEQTKVDLAYLKSVAQ